MIFTQIDTNRKYPRYFTKNRYQGYLFISIISATLFSQRPGLWNVLVKSAMGVFVVVLNWWLSWIVTLGYIVYLVKKNWLGIVHARIQINRVELILRFLWEIYWRNHLLLVFLHCKCNKIPYMLSENSKGHLYRHVKLFTIHCLA